ncbi:hypothetical protein [Sphingobacterium sp. UDSM-2020]|uniref:hypothetical protein n=1 Tax=Sphingobacterium sp. UDSM-2020 TaxID=2795738 RepID=UPI0019381BDB|nr:hypothetical protein [Sphingobacterium sp. UDSM-2020]QQD13752.1 hypothetical protein JAZ75_24715 [Sphingobacterium sp. UDSM-2020]
MKRICIYPKDIARITGKSYRQSLRIYNNIKGINGKETYQLITIDELCRYLGLDYNTVRNEL